MVLYEITNLEDGTKDEIWLTPEPKVGSIYGIGSAQYNTYADYIRIINVGDDVIDAERAFGNRRYSLKRV